MDCRYVKLDNVHTNDVGCRDFYYVHLSVIEVYGHISEVNQFYMITVTAHFSYCKMMQNFTLQKFRFQVEINVTQICK